MINTLEDTIEYMVSEDHKERLFAEYTQLEIRIERLQSVLTHYTNDTLTFKLDTPYEVLSMQLSIMLAYKDVIDLRMCYEGWGKL